MREAVTSLQSTVAKREVQDLSNRLAALAPIKLPAKSSLVNTAEKMDKSKDKEEPADIGDLMTRCNKARQELYTLMASQTVVDITRSKGGASNSGPSIRELNMRSYFVFEAFQQLHFRVISRKLKEAELRREVESLQTEMLRLMTSRRPGYRAESAFGTFASRELAKSLGNKVSFINECSSTFIPSVSKHHHSFFTISPLQQ